jgi:two-component system, NarL family, nitrate/nitrite response regulator NarL
MSSILVIEKNELVAAGIRTFLAEAGHDVAAVGDIDEVEGCARQAPSLVVLGLDSIPCGADWERRLWSNGGRPRLILFVRGAQLPNIEELAALDPDGVVLEHGCARKLAECVRVVEAGGKWVDPGLLHRLSSSPDGSHGSTSLTARESEVADWVSCGLRNKEIAARLRLSEGTIKMHLHHVYAKLRINTRTELVLSRYHKQNREVEARDLFTSQSFTGGRLPSDARATELNDRLSAS